MADEIKVGRRHSQADQDHVQTIYRSAMALGAMPDPPTPAIGEIPVETVVDPAKTVVWAGAEVKALGDGRIGGYLVRFGTPDQTDLTGDYFTKATDFGPARESMVLYHHGLDPQLGLRNLGAKSATLTPDDIGMWIAAQLDLRNAYEKAIYEQMVVTGKAAWSSGTAAHLVERKQVREGVYQITRWPLGLDASITPTPAEPRNAVLPLKSLPTPAPLQAPAQAAGDAAPADEAKSVQADQTIPHSEETNTMPDNTDIAAVVKAAVAEALSARDNQAAVKAAADAPGYDTGTDIKNVKVNDQEKPFKSFGDFLVAVQKRATNSIDTELVNRLQHHQTKAMKSNGLNELVGSEGGFLIGPNDVKPLTEAMYTTGEILSRITRNPVGPNSNGMTLYGIDETSRATGSRFGGVQGYWAAEGVSMTKSKPSFRKVDLRLNKVHALVYATDEMLQDSAYLESTVRRVAPLELQFRVEDAIVSGDGVGKPLGFAPGLVAGGAFISASKDVGQTATTVTIGNLAAIWGRLYAAGQKNAIILCNQDVIPQLFKIVSSNVSTTASLLQPPGVGGAPYFTFFGRPIIPVEYLSTMGTLADIVVIDPTQYQIIDKGGIQEAASMHVAFLTDEMVFRFTYRVDGAPLWASTLTPYKGSATVSPFVGVETRS